MSTATVKIAFERKIVVLPLNAILPMRQVDESVRRTTKYRRIAKSVREIGIIEPIVVAPSKDTKDQYLLLDGHLRYHALIEKVPRRHDAWLPMTTRRSRTTSGSIVLQSCKSIS